MFCGGCGNEIKGNFKFCPKCGKPINNVEQQKKEANTPVTKPVAQTEPKPVPKPQPKAVAIPESKPIPKPGPKSIPVPEPKPVPKPQPVEEEKKSSNKGIILGGVAAILIAAAVGGFWFFQKQSGDSELQAFAGAMNKGQYAQALKQMNVEESSWINQEAFKTYLDWAKSKSEDPLVALLEASEGVTVKEKKEDKDNISYVVITKTKNGEGKELTLKTTKKDGLKLVPSCITALELELPEGTGVEVDSFKVEGKSTGKGMATYTIPQIFLGPHKIKFSHSVLEDSSKDFILTKEEKPSFDQLWPKRVVKQDYEQKVETAVLHYVNSLIKTALEKNELKDAQLVFVQDGKTMDMFKQFSQYFGNAGSRITEMKANSGKMYSISSDDKGVVKCQYIYDGIYSSKAATGDAKLSGKFNGTVQLELVPGKEGFEAKQLNSYNVHIMKAR